MLTYRHVNVSWLSAAALRRTRHLVWIDALINMAASEFHGVHDAAVIPINVDPRCLALRLRW